jgi:flagellar biosynthesis chaperone FliJ
MAEVARDRRATVRNVEAEFRLAAAALGTARLQRGIYEKLEQRFVRAERERRRRREFRELDEANAMSHAYTCGVP